MSPSTAELARALVASPRWEWAEGMTMFPAGFERERWLLCWCARRYIRRADGTWPDEPIGWEGGAYQTSGGKWWGIAGSDDPIDLCDGWLPDLDDPATAGVLLGMLADEMGRWPIALLALVDEDVEALVLRGGALDEDLPTLGVAVARALLSTWEQP